MSNRSRPVGDIAHLSALGDLGKSLGEAVRKLLRLPIVDEKAIKELVKDLQRALLQADVNVELVLQISRNVEKRAIEEKLPPGISRREHVIKVLYEELTRFLGEEAPKITIPPGKTHVIMLVGIQGTGKCVIGETLVPLADGRILSAKQVYDEAVSARREIRDENGYYTSARGLGIKVYSAIVETGRIERSEVSRVWKLPSPPFLAKVRLDSGNACSITTTLEHPFFVLKEGRITQVPSAQLGRGMLIMVPRLLPEPRTDSRHVDLLQTELVTKLFVSVGPRFSDLLLKKLLKRYGTRKRIWSELARYRSYVVFLWWFKKRIFPLWFLKAATEQARISQRLMLQRITRFKTKGSIPIRLPCQVTVPLMRFLGLLMSNGRLDGGTVRFFNNDLKLCREFTKLAKRVFRLNATIRTDKRFPQLKSVLVHSAPLSEYFTQVFEIPRWKKSRNLRLGPAITMRGNRLLAAFLKGYVDGDAGSPIGNHKGIDISTASREAAEKLATLLLRFGIRASVSTRTIGERCYYRLFIGGQSKLTTFERKIGFTDSNKAAELHRVLLNPSCFEETELVSDKGLFSSIARDLSCQDHHLARRLGVSKTTILRWKQGITRMPRASLQTITRSGSASLMTETLTRAQNWLSDDIAWVKVKSVDIIPSKEAFVYDLTVPGTHNFATSTAFVHNTTASVKLARFYQKRGLRVGIICADNFRPGAYEQLEQLASKVSVPVYGNPSSPSPERLVKDGFSHFEKEKEDLIIIDTAGRHKNETELMDEMKRLAKLAKPDEIVLAVDGSIGQAAMAQARAFNEATNIGSILVTKLDGTAKGGGALSAVAATKARIKFISVGEGTDDLEQFVPSNFVGRMLGIGDVASLVEKVREAEIKIPEKKARAMLEGRFNLKDMYDQLEAVRKMGPLKKVLGMVPGGYNIPDDAMENAEEKMDAWRVMIQSMTKEEVEEPRVIDSSRARRIARGSGRSEREVKELVNQYVMMKKMMKSLKRRQGTLMKRFPFQMPS